MFTGAKAINGN